MPKPFDISFLGRRVRILSGSIKYQFLPGGGYIPFDIHPEWIGQEATIVNSFNLAYGKIEDIGKPDDSYSILFDDGNRASWFRLSQLEIIKQTIMKHTLTIQLTEDQYLAMLEHREKITDHLRQNDITDVRVEYDNHPDEAESTYYYLEMHFTFSHPSITQLYTITGILMAYGVK